ncbi:MAG: nucleotidyltransferase domain-containing protein [Patescibacteria group bacterium]
MVKKSELKNNRACSDDLRIIRLYLNKLTVSGIPVEQAYLFGSRAKGTAHKWSDLDLCVVSPAFGQDRFEERLKLMNLREDASEMIEPHPFSVKDFQDRFDPLAAQIRLTGIRVA